MLRSALQGEYDLVIDARSEREFYEDHLPGAVNLPVVVNDEYAEVGTTHRTDTHRAYVIGVSYALKNISHAIHDLVSRYPKDARMLVYCFRGGKRSKLWLDALSTIGYSVERLPGGWKAYRAWVREQLAQLPSRFSYHVLCGPTGCGKTRMLSALADVGAQVLDLEGLASHRGSLIGDIPGVAQPTQKWFDSLLVDKLRRFEPSRPVWVESESKKIGAIQLPAELLQAMHASKVFAISAPMSERVKLWREDYSHFEHDLAAMMERLRHLRPLVGGEEFALWERLAAEGRAAELFQRLMEAHYDPAYARSIGKNYPAVEESSKLTLERLDRQALLEVAEQLHRVPITA
ncbi:MAG: tRNA 2-selenouridine(34) synthase MnmH [Betaproteobacteria bacterium RIFCSPLOWO2_02_FULL_67_19]|nr:MAG: tRNA 2-selenouridine(34) synthase MnmH [Betaproteobacteria bacterium RIFCSPLOWO2_02_FULL_67_19]